MTFGKSIPNPLPIVCLVTPLRKVSFFIFYEHHTSLFGHSIDTCKFMEQPSDTVDQQIDDFIHVGRRR
jgi:hypothetical protein